MAPADDVGGDEGCDGDEWADGGALWVGSRAARATGKRPRAGAQAQARPRPPSRTAAGIQAVGCRRPAGRSTCNRL